MNLTILKGRVAGGEIEWAGPPNVPQWQGRIPSLKKEKRELLYALALDALQEEGIQHLDRQRSILVYTPTRTLVWWPSTCKWYVCGTLPKESFAITHEEFLKEALV